eukprot:TRINITY_DN94704_c0_g1_i1.p1 TRINITY_DN94704_c0_g1~~TRINITY_DN94704_c0_g1_i1.p1  ORF type:complete len:657 (-),score=92.91 TRINITY_DN94704_c0_g1_i1:180-1901(-)
MHLVVGDAAVVRLRSFEPNSSSECVWPHCAPYCVPCAKTNKYWSCIVDKTCQENSECMVVTCYAEPGYCYADAYPQKAVCFMGAKPKKQTFVFNGQILRFGLAPVVPLPGASVTSWINWLLQASLTPIVFVILSLAFVVYMVYLLLTGKAAKMTWLPRSETPVMLLGLGIIVLMIVFEILRQKSVLYLFKSINDEVDYIQNITYVARRYVKDLQQVEEQYNSTIMAAPGTCGKYNPLATNLVSMLTGILYGQFRQLQVMLQVVYSTLYDVIAIIEFGKLFFLTPAKWWIQWGPLIPVVLLFLSVSIVFFRLRRAQQSMERTAIRDVSVCIAVVMVINILLSAFMLYSGIAVAGMCLNVDDNLVAASEKSNFESSFHSKLNVNEVLQHIARYYLLGLNVNPLATILQNLDSVFYMILNFYSQFSWIVDLAAASCRGLQALDPEKAVHVLMDGVKEIGVLFHASRVYPFYQELVHEAVCSQVPKLCIFSWLSSSFVFLVAVPLKLFIADRHLQQSLDDKGAELLSCSDLDEVGDRIEDQLNDLDEKTQAIVLQRLIDSRGNAVTQQMGALQSDSE